MAKYFFIAAVVMIGWMAFVKPTQAVGLAVTASNAQVVVDQTLLITISVNAEDATINSAQGVLSFSTDLLEPMETDLTNSVFTFWAREPKFNKTIGKIEFLGGRPGAGYQGSNGLVYKAIFQTRAAGQATFNLSAIKLMTADGREVALDNTQPSVEVIINSKVGAVEVQELSDRTSVLAQPISSTTNTNTSPVIAVTTGESDDQTPGIKTTVSPNVENNKHIVLKEGTLFIDGQPLARLAILAVAGLVLLLILALNIAVWVRIWQSSRIMIKRELLVENEVEDLYRRLQTEELTTKEIMGQLAVIDYDLRGRTGKK